MNIILMLSLLSVSWLLAKECTDSYGIINTSSYRILFATLSVFLLYTIIQRKYPKLIINRFTLLASGLGYIIYFFFISISLSSSQPSSVGLATVLLPVIGYLFSVSRKLEDISFANLGLCLSAIAGCVIFSGSYSSDISFFSISMALIAVIGYATYGVIYKEYLVKQSGLEVLYSCLVIASIPSIISVILSSYYMEPKYHIGLSGYGQLFLLGAIFTAPIYFTYQKVISDFGVTFANILGLMTPILIVLGELFLSHRTEASLNEIIGLTICLSSIFTFIIRDREMG